MSKPKILIGIGIDERLQWATACATQDGIQDDSIKHYSRPLDEGPLDVQLTDLMRHLKAQQPKVFDEVSAIGVGTSGIVDTDRHTLSNITRKPAWRTNRSYILNFQDFFSDHIKRPDFDFDCDLSVHNEASGSALAEFAWGIQTGHVPAKTRRLLLIRVDEGINFGVINLGLPMEDESLKAGGQSAGGMLLPATRHPEAGHMRPRRHEEESAELLPEHSGCSSHPDCYEALASMARVRKQFGGPDADKDFSLRDLPLNHPMWNIEADYIAQLCYAGVMVLSPQIIILSGGIGLTNRFLDKVRDKFSGLNRGHFLYPEMGVLPQFIKRGLFGPEVTVWGALQLAERASRREQGRNTKIPPIHYDGLNIRPFPKKKS